MVDFEWPWQYNFPPFFTLQPNLNTREKQLSAWNSLVLAYHRHHNKYTLDVLEALGQPPFTNKKIGRSLSRDMLYMILDDLQKKGNCEWLDKSKRQCYIMWRTAEEWGKLIYKWATDSGMTNSVCTLYELMSGDDTVNQEFHGVDQHILMKALRSLEQQKKAEIISFDGNEGVKFF